MPGPGRRPAHELTFWRHTVLPLLLLLLCPWIVIILAYFIQHCDGTEAGIWDDIQKYDTPFEWLTMILKSQFPSLQLMGVTFAYYTFQYALLHVVPGQWVNGPPTPSGFVPKYKANGLLCFAINLLLFVACYAWQIIPVDLVLDHLTSFIIAASLYGYLITFALYIQARVAPVCEADVEITGKWIYDYFKGLEWYPQILGINAKQLINCRISMTQWALICLSYALKDYRINASQSGAIDWNYIILSPVWMSAVLQIIYLAKFFHWEIGYCHTMDVQHDRCGFYITWGCTAWVASVYTFHTGWLCVQSINPATHDWVQLSFFTAALIFVLGNVSIFINYHADAQKMAVRQTDGKCNVFGSPAKVIRAEYTDDSGEKKRSILLVSGYWGIARHFHYIPEILAALFWTVPVHSFSFLPYFYVVYLTILLTDRSGRDDQRCRAKYGKYWDRYCEHVPYKIVPGIF